VSRRTLIWAVVLTLAACTGTERRAPTTLTIAVGQLASSPVPTMTEGASANSDVANLLFLRLAELPPSYRTSGDSGFIPRLARSWERRDSVTLVFHLDPNARWQDGVPVSAQDVAFTIARARSVSPQMATLLTTIRSVEVEDSQTVAFHFSEAYPEQLYNATYHVPILPAHLLEGVGDHSEQQSAFVRQPVGSGPYRLAEVAPGDHLVLQAVEDFFLGRPTIDRVIFRLGSDPEARNNMLLTGQADAVQAIAPADAPRIAANPDLALYTVPGFGVGYLLFNQQDPNHLDRPHPILADPRVRSALVHALDRPRMLQAVYREFAYLPQGPAARLHWIVDTTETGVPFDTTVTTRLLTQAGWARRSDGTWSKGGHALSLTLNYPSTSRVRAQFAQLAQEQWRRVGIDVSLNGMEGALWIDRRTDRQFDIDFSSATMDPSPAGITQSWSCAGIGGSNVAGYCDPKVDSLLGLALTDAGNALAHYRAVLETIRADAAAAFLYSPSTIFGIHRRFENVTIVPYSYWLDVWRWTVRNGAGGGASQPADG